jgi:cytochrome c-type biogenesis protein
MDGITLTALMTAGGFVLDAVVALLILAVGQPVKTALPVLEPIIGVGSIASASRRS